MDRQIVRVPNGFVIHGDATHKLDLDKAVECADSLLPLVVTDPPYGNIVNERWDEYLGTQQGFCDFLLDVTRNMGNLIADRGAMYIWGGLGSVGFRPFLLYSALVEQETDWEIGNSICWSKKRAYGLSYNYLFTREECLYLVKGDFRKPRLFNIPLLETERGYAGYNPKYPAKSKFYRRTNVWMDINEIFRGKVHKTQKQQRLFEIPIEVHTQPGEFVIDPFAGSGTLGMAAQKLDRQFVLIEKDQESFDLCVSRLTT